MKVNEVNRTMKVNEVNRTPLLEGAALIQFVDLS